MLRPNFEEWCLINAPDAMKSSRKEDILLYMHDAYISRCVADKITFLFTTELVT